MLNKYQEKWNKQADKFNQWSELDSNEKCEFIINDFKREINDVIEFIKDKKLTFAQYSIKSYIDADLVIKKLKQIVE